jgi:hypothetical protein
MAELGYFADLKRYKCKICGKGHKTTTEKNVALLLLSLIPWKIFDDPRTTNAALIQMRDPLYVGNAVGVSTRKALRR